MAKSIQTLKSYFLDGKKPTENEFADLIEAFVHRNDDLKTILGNFAELAEAQAGVVNDKYMTPFLTKAAILALTRLANIPALKAELEGLFLGKTAKAADSAKLDGKDSTAFQAAGNYLTAHQSLANYYTKAQALAAFLGKTAKAADSGKLNGKQEADFLLKTSLSDLPGESRAGKIASSKAVKAVNDKIPSWATDREDFLHVICAGRVNAAGSRQDYWGKDRVSGFPFSVKKLTDTGHYKITHNFGNKYYGLSGNGNVNTNDTDGWNMFVSIKERNSNDCTVVVGNDSAPDNASFSFILFDLN